VDLVLGWKEFNGTPHFVSLPQGERRIERISPHPDPLQQNGEERRKMKRFKQCPSHPDLFLRGGEG